MADLIFYNGIVHTMAGESVSAVAVSGERIEAAGTDEEILALADASCRKIDLKGRCLVPGFNDSHCHILLTGLGYERLNLRGAVSVEDLIQKGRDYIETRQIPEGTWIIGEGFDHNVFPEPVLPDGKAAEAISSKHPVLLERVCGHVGAANAMALEIAGFTKDTVITGGVIDLDEQGNMTGVIRETALDQFKTRIPKPSLKELKSAIEAAARIANQYGVTSAQTDDLEGGTLKTVVQAYRELEQEGKLTLRIYEEVQAARIPVLQRLIEEGLLSVPGSDYFKIGNIKLITDGSLGARTAYLREEYCDDPGNRGISVYTQEELDEIIMAVHNAGMQAACHAIGDGAVEQCVNAIEKAYRTDGIDHRHRIVHCQFGDRALYARMAENKIAADIQPAFTASDSPLTASRVGIREKDGYSWKTMQELGVRLGGGSDSPVETLNPVWGMYCAINRTDADGEPEGGWYPEQKLSIEEALALYTAGGAYLSFEEDRKGMIKKGYLADLAVLSEDIYQVPSEELYRVKTEMTVLGGRIVYEHTP